MSTVARRDQFVATADGITHKPTGAAFMPYAGERYFGSFYSGQLGNLLINGDQAKPPAVSRQGFNM